MADSRSYSAGMFAIELEGAHVGFAKSVAGGAARADVVDEPVGADHVVRKHIGNVKYEDIVLTVGANMSRAFFDWIASLLDRKPQRKNGAILFLDYDGKEKQRLSWTSGLITEVTFPQADAASKDPASLTVKITPEYTSHGAGSGTKVTSKVGAQKAWLPSNFRLTIPGVNCSRVSKIDELTVVQRATGREIGAERDVGVEPGVLEIPNLVVTLGEKDAADFVAWQDDFVIKGNNGQSNEKQGTLEFLAPNLKETILTLKLRQLGIFALSPLKVESGSEAIARVQAEMYCEEMSLEYPKAAEVSTSPTPAAVVGEPATDGATAVVVAALRTLLDQPLNGVAAPDRIAARLRATSDSRLEGKHVAQSAERGQRIGAEWARERATMDELEQIGRARGGEWTSLVLAEGHSLIEDLEAQGVVPERHDGPLSLERDPFVEGLVDGAADVLEEVRPHL